MATGINGDETANAQLIQIPDYDEDLEEAFIGPYIDMLNEEAYDDEYEAESAAMIEGQEPQASVVIQRGAVSGQTHIGNKHYLVQSG